MVNTLSALTRLGSIIAAIMLLGVGCPRLVSRPAVSPGASALPIAGISETPPSSSAYQDIDLSTLPAVDSAFAVTLTVPASWNAEVVQDLEAVNLYDPAAPGATPREQSQIFLRHFRAERFLTLNTVTVHERAETTVVGRPAVTYAIEKKSEIAAFPGQPSWRNARHRVTDIRVLDTSPSEFIVIAQNPSVSNAVFDTVLQSLRLAHHDTPAATLVYPARGFREAVTKKPFGLFVTPTESPVQPERFRGFHTGADAELPAETSILAIADGTVVRSGRVEGYGGVVAIEHLIGGKRIVAIYGHLRPIDLPRVGTTVQVGETLGVLGEGFSADTDGERSHLHFGLSVGTGIDVRGYVPTKEELKQWHDPVQFLEQNSAREIGK